MSWTTSLAASVVTIGLATAVGATTITFTEPEFPGNFIDTGAEYASSGVVIDNAYYYVDTRDLFDGQGISAGPTSQTGTAQTATIRFDGITDYFTFDWYTTDGDLDVFAYDSLGNALGSFLDGVGSGTDTITADGIASVTFSGIGGFAQLSTISYDLAAVPLPGSISLLLGALGAGALIRRRRVAA